MIHPHTQSYTDLQIFLAQTDIDSKILNVIRSNSVITIQLIVKKSNVVAGLSIVVVLLLHTVNVRINLLLH